MAVRAVAIGFFRLRRGGRGIVFSGPRFLARRYRTGAAPASVSRPASKKTSPKPQSANQLLIRRLAGVIKDVDLRAEGEVIARGGEHGLAGLLVSRKIGEGDGGLVDQ